MIHINNFYMCGISFKTAAINIRSHYALSDAGYATMLDILRRTGSPGMILQTCNRCEVYFFADKPDDILASFIELSTGSEEELRRLGYFKKAKDAYEHLMRVGVGLESQIPGDFEIIGQVKKAFREAVEHDNHHGLLEKMVNGVIRASRRVKNETEFCTGSSSVSYACVRFLRDHIPELGKKKILLFGLGKLGQTTLANLLKHVDSDQVSIMNKSQDKVDDLAIRYKIKGLDITEKKSAIKDNDIIIVATGADKPIVFERDLSHERSHWILDLAVPRNVDPQVGKMHNVRLLDVDELSETINETIESRIREIPDVEAVVDEELSEFMNWYHRKEMSQLTDFMGNALREITRETLLDFGVDKDPDEITETIARKHRKLMFDHLRQFFAEGERAGRRDSLQQVSR